MLFSNSYFSFCASYESGSVVDISVVFGAVGMADVVKAMLDVRLVVPRDTVENIKVVVTSSGV